MGGASPSHESVVEFVDAAARSSLILCLMVPPSGVPLQEVAARLHSFLLFVEPSWLCCCVLQPSFGHKKVWIADCFELLLSSL